MPLLELPKLQSMHLHHGGRNYDVDPIQILKHLSVPSLTKLKIEKKSLPSDDYTDLSLAIQHFPLTHLELKFDERGMNAIHRTICGFTYVSSGIL